jgi:hypothetical protein
MPLPRKDPDSIEHKRRQLARQERLLAEQMSRLSAQLRRGGAAFDEDPARPIEPPVWRLEEDGRHPRRVPELSPQPKRNLGRQRQRDMIIFFIMLGALLIVGFMVYLLLHLHTQGINGV